MNNSKIQFNMQGDMLYRTHTNIWSRNCQDESISGMVRKLKPGDKIQLFAIAYTYWGWENWVKDAEITIESIPS
jgi:hypothetical protein